MVELAVARIDLDLLALVQVHRHLDRSARGDRGRLRAALDRVALEARVGLRDLDLDEHGRRHAEELIVSVEQRGVVVLDEPLGVVADEVGRNSDLLIRIVVHEVVVDAVVVEILHLLGDELHAVELRACIAGLVDRAAIAQVLDLVAHECAALARLDMLELDDRVVLVADLEAHAVLEISGADGLRCHG